MNNTLLISIALFCAVNAQAVPLRALIIDGQNNHAVWPKASIMMRQYLEQTGLFEVDIACTRYIWRAESQQHWLPLAGVGETEQLKQPKSDPYFAPKTSPGCI